MVHGEDLRAEVKNDELVEAVRDDYSTADFSPADRALCDYAARLTISPATVTQDDIRGLRQHGFTDRQIHDAAQVTAYFNYINRIADGLGVDLEPGMPPAPQVSHRK